MKQAEKHGLGEFFCILCCECVVPLPAQRFSQATSRSLVTVIVLQAGLLKLNFLGREALRFQTCRLPKWASDFCKWKDDQNGILWVFLGHAVLIGSSRVLQRSGTRGPTVGWGWRGSLSHWPGTGQKFTAQLWGADGGGLPCESPGWFPVKLQYRLASPK